MHSPHRAAIVLIHCAGVRFGLFLTATVPAEGVSLKGLPFLDTVISICNL